MTIKISNSPPPPVAPSGPVTVYVKPHGNKYTVLYAFAGRSIRKIINSQQLAELLINSAYVVKQ